MGSPTASQPTVYVETSVVSYLAARPAADPILRNHQELTRRWWAQERPLHRVLVSPVVVAEAERGDVDAARRRAQLLAEAELLDPSPEVEALADEIRAALRLPARAALDGAHLVYAVYYELDYRVAWNCVHLANPRSRRLLADMTRERGLWLPIIYTPAEMMGRQMEV